MPGSNRLRTLITASVTAWVVVAGCSSEFPSEDFTVGELRDGAIDAAEVPDDAPIAPQDTGPDAGLTPAVDAPPADTGRVLPQDSGGDAGLPAPRDTGIDTSITPPRDTGIDTGSIPARDTGIDAGSIPPRDTGIDVPRDTGRDTGIDVPRDTGIDVPRDTGVDTGSPAGDDPVVYQGTFPARTGRFSANLTVLGERRAVLLVVPTNAGPTPPLLVLFHGTNGDGSVVMDETSAQTLANSAGVIVVAPTSRWLPFGDFDHDDGSTYWETATNPNPNTNQDLVLTRAILAEARRAYNVDRTRVYALGHSNGAFMAHFSAQILRDRIAAYASNSGGIVNCRTTLSCGFEASGTTCAQLRSRAGYCACTGPDLPIPVATSGNRPAAFITHGSRDPLVSVYYSCVLEDRLRAAGATFQTTILNDEGHAIPRDLAQTAWAFLRTRTLGMP